MDEQLLSALSLPLMHLREMRTEVLRHVLVPVRSFAVRSDVFLHDDPRLELLLQKVGLFPIVTTYPPREKIIQSAMDSS